MIFQIKNRFTAAVQFECELSAEMETESYSVKLGFAAKAAYKADAYLARANLADAYLADAYLADANLARANLARANLARAYLARANLAGADLADAYLARANLVGAKNAPAHEAHAEATLSREDRHAARAAKFRERFPHVPVVESLDAKILAAIESGSGKLDMSSWHRCKTTHCRAGWAITLAGRAGAELELRYGPEDAGRRIYLASSGRVPHFFASDEAALADIREQAALQRSASPAQNASKDDRG